jgi:Lysyl oxidase
MGMKRRLPAASATRLAASTALLSAALLAIGTTTAAVAAPRVAAPKPAAPAAGKLAAAATPGPEIRLIRVQRVVEVPRFGKQVYVYPDVYVAALTSAFRIDVSRASYSKPSTATQVIYTADGAAGRSLPSWLIADNWVGLRHFLRVTIRTARGRIVVHSDTAFCPGEGELAKATPDSANTDPYPASCDSGDPFPMGEIWALPRGWANDPGGLSYNLGYGTYKLTETISPQYVRMFGISKRYASTTVTIKVVKFSACCGPGGCCYFSSRVAPVPAGFVRVGRTPAGRAPAAPAGRPAPSLPATATLTHVPQDALPDLIPLPSWGISVSNTKKTSTAFLDFGATVWIGGHSPLDVEGFRVPGTSKMLAYQYFYRNGTKLIGRMRVGTMGFSGYNAWHFNQFAQYFLLNKHKKIVVRSRKVGFCIAPTDNVDMLLPHATWQPSYTGIAGNCGDPEALWATEILPIGWGDTYIQTVPYQSFDITRIPDGTYYIEIVANPEHLLHETNPANDVSLREVIISGKAGHRTVRVPAFDGLDPESGKGTGYI